MAGAAKLTHEDVEVDGLNSLFQPASENRPEEAGRANHNASIANYVLGVGLNADTSSVSPEIESSLSGTINTCIGKQWQVPWPEV